MKTQMIIAVTQPGAISQPAVSRPLVRHLMGDSPEVMQQFYAERVRSLGEMLEQLNLLENPSEIEFICREIVLVREALKRLEERGS